MLVVSLVALVIVPNAAAIRFTDASRLPPAGAVGSRYFHQFEGHGGCGPLSLPVQDPQRLPSLPVSLARVERPRQRHAHAVAGRPLGRAQRPGPAFGGLVHSEKVGGGVHDQHRGKGSVPAAAAPAPSGGGGGGGGTPSLRATCRWSGTSATRSRGGHQGCGGGWRVRHARCDRLGDERGGMGDRQGRRAHREDEQPRSNGELVRRPVRRDGRGGRRARPSDADARGDPVRDAPGHRTAHPRAGYLPMAFILAGVAMAGAGLLVAITDDMSSALVSSLGTEQSDNVLQAVGDAYKDALDEESGSRSSASSSAPSSSRSAPSCSGSR